MSKSASPSRSRAARSLTAPCGCRRCTCAHAPACRCHVFNALLALALWDLRRAPRALAS